MSKTTTNQKDIAARYFSKTGGYRGDITLQLLDDLDAIYTDLCETMPTFGRGELQRDMGLRGIEAEIKKYYAEIGECVVKMWREQQAKEGKQ